MKSTGLVLDPEVSVDVEPGVVTLYDRSRFRNNGVMTDVTWVRRPSGLWVMEFNDASSFVDCGHDASFNLQHLTLEAWVVNAEGLSVNSQHILVKKTGYVSHFGYMIYLESGGVYFNLGDGGSHRETYVGPLAWDVTAWYHIVLTFDNARFYVYRNGVHQGDRALAFTIVHDATDFYIGRMAGVWYNGQIAMARVYNYPLTPGQVLQRFEATRRLFGV